MEVSTIIQSIHDSPLSNAIRQVGVLFPALESLHVIGLALVVGTIAIVDLRLIGYAAHRPSAYRLVRELLPFTWGAFALTVCTGLLMFASKAVDYAANSLFLWKMLVLMLAGANMAVFHLGAYRRIEEWDTALPPPMAARMAGLSSLLLWTITIVLGRWIGFV